MTKRPAKERLFKAMYNHQEWLTTGEIAKLDHGLSINHVYVLLSQLVLKDKSILRKKNESGANVYKMTDKAVKETEKLEGCIEKAKPEEVRKISISKTKERVTWTDDERWSLAECIDELRRKHPYLSFSDAMLQAQTNKLESSRRRLDITSPNQVPWIDKMLSVLKKANEKREVPVTPGPRLSEYDASTLLGEVLGRIKPLIKDLVIDIITDPKVSDVFKKSTVVTERRQVFRHDPMPFSEDRPKKKRVMIYGLNKPIHQNEIQRDFSGDLDIRIGNMHEPGAILKQKNSSVDLVIVLTDHVKHSFTDTMKRENIGYEMMTGNIGKLREKLNDIINQSRGH